MREKRNDQKNQPHLPRYVEWKDITPQGDTGTQPQPLYSTCLIHRVEKAFGIILARSLASFDSAQR